MVVVLVMEREEKSFPMVDKVVSDILVMVAMEDLGVAPDPTQELEAAADIPAAAQETGATLVMAVAPDPISRVRPQIQAVRQEKMKVMVRSSLPIALVSALSLFLL